MAIYLKLGNVKGNVTAQGYIGCIAVLSLKFNVGRNVSMEAGNLSNRESSKPALSQIEIIKIADNSVAALLKEAVTGSAGQEAILSFVRTGTDQVQEFMSYKLSNCIVSGYRIYTEGEYEPTEIITLSYSAIEASYKDRDASIKATSVQRIRYDLKGAKVA